MLAGDFAWGWGEGVEEGAAVDFGEDAGVEDDGDAFIAFGADEAADALAEFEDGFGDAVFCEGVAAAVFDVFDSGGGEWVVWDGEGEACAVAAEMWHAVQ